MLLRIGNAAMSRCLLIGCLLPGLALAQQAIAPSSVPPPLQREVLRARVELNTALSLRSGATYNGGVDLVYDAVQGFPSPTYFQLAGVYNPVGWSVGWAYHASFDRFRLQGAGLRDVVDASVNSALLGGGVVYGLDLPFGAWAEVQGGLELGGWANAAVEDLDVRVRRAGYLGIHLGALLQVPLADPWSVILRLGGVPAAAASVESAPLSTRRFESQLQVSYGRFPFAGYQAALYAEYGFSRQVVSEAPHNPALFSWRNTHRFGVGLRFLLPERVGPPPPPSGPGRIRGRLLFGNDLPANGVQIRVNGEPGTRTTPDGRFIVSAVGPGKILVTAEGPGFLPLSREVDIPPGTEVTLEPITLERPSGPGTLRGVALFKTGPDRTEPAPQIPISVGGGEPVATGPDGAFTLEKVGPGPVTVTARMRGYKVVEEVVAVPPGGEATVQLILERAGTEELAAFRGQVRSTVGSAVQATLRIPEAQVRTRTKLDGTFQVRLPAGRYTVVFEAEGFVPQRKSVEVAGGDQTLFYVDLAPSDR